MLAQGVDRLCDFIPSIIPVASRARGHREAAVSTACYVAGAWAASSSPRTTRTRRFDQPSSTDCAKARSNPISTLICRLEVLLPTAAPTCPAAHRAGR